VGPKSVDFGHLNCINFVFFCPFLELACLVVPFFERESFNVPKDDLVAVFMFGGGL
jgi:hypothetical protein